MPGLLAPASPGHKPAKTRAEKKCKEKAAPGFHPMPLNQVPPSCYSPTKEIRSTIADVGLNFRVRNGNGCGPHSKDGGKNLICS